MAGRGQIFLHPIYLTGRTGETGWGGEAGFELESGFRAF